MAPGEFKIADGKWITYSFTFVSSGTTTIPFPVRTYSTEDVPRRERHPSWGELNLSWGHGPRPPRVMKSAVLVSPLIRWMAKALIGGQK